MLGGARGYVCVCLLIFINWVKLFLNMSRYYSTHTSNPALKKNLNNIIHDFLNILHLSFISST